VTLSLPADRVAVKICGVTNREDARAATEAGADLLGFNTWTGSKRFLPLEAHADWIAALPVVRVALLVNATREEAACVAALPYVDALQLHGDEDAAFCAELSQLGKPLIKALRVRAAGDFSAADTYSTEHVLLDAHVAGAYGGTGARVDVGLARAFRARHPQLKLWLAGGLAPENVAEAIRAARPRVVDVSSGVESAPGRKDLSKVRAFCLAARQA
jgi:phosphoribosylanthranilate isomerase